MTQEEIEEQARILAISYLEDSPEFAYVYEDEDLIDEFDPSNDDLIKIHNEMASILHELARGIGA